MKDRLKKLMKSIFYHLFKNKAGMQLIVANQVCVHYLCACVRECGRVYARFPVSKICGTDQPMDLHAIF